MEDYTKIYDMPPVPKGIIDAVNNNKFAVFIGAGISQLVGCVSWSELALKLIDKCYLLNIGDGQDKLNFRQKQNLITDTDYKKTITIIKQIYSENGSESQFYEVVNSLLVDQPLEKRECPEIYNELLKIRGLFLTTNLDTHFDKYFSDRIVYIDKDFDQQPTSIDRTKLYHVHGSMKKPEDMVLTLENYFERYKDSTNLNKFLSNVFSTYSILFIGYGLGEFEMLDYLFTKFSRDSGQQHFMLGPYYSGEEGRLKLDQYYYRTMHIQVVAYRADDKGHARLNDVIKEWVKEIKLKSVDLLRRYNEIDAIVEKVEHD